MQPNQCPSNSLKKNLENMNEANATTKLRDMVSHIMDLNKTWYEYTAFSSIVL